MIEHFYFDEAIYDYGFGPTHPLKPERLRRMFALLKPYVGDLITRSDLATREDLLLVHDPVYLDAVQQIDDAVAAGESERVENLRTEHGFWGDNPAFPGMYRAAAAYTGASAAAARAVRDGARLAFGMGGGLHHALADKAAGFCIFNDCAVACAILRERFDRVAYVDIDVHHGDGVQWLFYKDPTVLTCSIHESPRSLWPGTGGLNEMGVDFTSLNVPVAAGTTRDVWLDAFRQTILPALQSWKPGAIVLQMGADTHHLDPLAHVLSDQSAWLSSIKDIQALDIPLVALGGGGYEWTTVPRMWASAVMTLSGVEYTDAIPAELHETLGAKFFSDPDYRYPKDGGSDAAKFVVDAVREEQLPHLQS
jgi:acetoin utilization protein AcuC